MKAKITENSIVWRREAAVQLWMDENRREGATFKQEHDRRAYRIQERRAFPLQIDNQQSGGRRPDEQSYSDAVTENTRYSKGNNQ